jgi:hypothetical protein
MKTMLALAIATPARAIRPARNAARVISAPPPTESAPADTLELPSPFSARRHTAADPDSDPCTIALKIARGSPSLWRFSLLKGGSS